MSNQRALTLLAACYSATCAPPPVGTGGSSEGSTATGAKSKKMSERARYYLDYAINAIKTGPTAMPDRTGRNSFEYYITRKYKKGDRLPVADAGLTFDPGSPKIVAAARAADKAGTIDWSKVKTTVLPPRKIKNLHLSEETVPAHSVERVVKGIEDRRRDYPAKLYRHSDGELHVVDGNTRAVMYYQMGIPMDVKIIDKDTLGL